MGSEVTYRRLAGERRGVVRGNAALCLVPLYGVISLKEKNVEIFNKLYNVQLNHHLLFSF